jgi:hypothetical protein
MKCLLSFLLGGMLAASASAQALTVSGGGTITLGQSAYIVASPSSGVATAYNLIENGVVVQTVGTFGTGGSGTDVGRPHTFTVTPSAPGTYIYSAQVALNIFRGHIDYLHSNNSVTLTVVAPNQAPTIIWTGTPGTVASGQGYTVSAHGHDDDGNLTAVSIWKNSQPFAFAGGGDGTDGDAQNPTSDTGPQTVTYTAQAFDAAGAVSGIITQTVTVAAAPVQYSLGTSAGTGGSVSAGGTFDAGTIVTVSAAPDATHDFAGWSGDAGGTANPVSLVLDGNKAVQANFTAKLFALTTSAGVGGSVTAGGNYVAGSLVTVGATADPGYRFAGWAGDASGIVPSIAVIMDRPRNVQAVFSTLATQTIDFPAIADRPPDTPAFAPGASASSGLPVTYAVSGPAVMAGGLLQLTGTGAVTVTASQGGDVNYLPATPASRTFNVAAPSAVKYRGTGRTLLLNQGARGVNFILGQP